MSDTDSSSVTCYDRNFQEENRRFEPQRPSSGLSERILTWFLQILGSAAAIIFGVYGVLSWESGTSSNKEAEAANMMALVALCAPGSEPDTSFMASFCRGVVLQAEQTVYSLASAYLGTITPLPAPTTSSIHTTSSSSSTTSTTSTSSSTYSGGSGDGTGLIPQVTIINPGTTTRTTGTASMTTTDVSSGGAPRATALPQETPSTSSSSSTVSGTLGPILHSNDSDALSDKAIIGIGVGTAIAVVAFIITLLTFCLRKKRH